MSKSRVAAIHEAMKNVIDPELRKDIVTLNMLQDVTEPEEGSVQITIALTTPGCPLKDSFRRQVSEHALAVEGVENVSLVFTAMTEKERAALKTMLTGGRQSRTIEQALPEKSRIICVASGKGGVGKSTVAVNLAVAAAREGHKVGLIDADVYGYSIPLMLGINQKPVTIDGMIVPPIAYDVQCMSIGFFLDQDAPVMWRGPMLHRAIEQFLGDVHWDDPDMIFIDMPPGTGDVAISLAQMLPASEVVLVTTPQVAAQQVASRAAVMADKLGQQITGVIENMRDSDTETVFGSGGGELLAQKLETDFLGAVTLDSAIREGGDTGAPVSATDNAVATVFAGICERILQHPAPQRPEPDPPTPAERIRNPLTVL